MDLVQLINQVGFPIAVCVYCFYTQNTVLKTLNESMISLKEAVLGMTKKDDNKNE